MRLAPSLPVEVTGQDPDDQHYDRIRQAHGRAAANEVAALANRVPVGMPIDKAWQWALERWEAGQAAELAATGYDPFLELGRWTS